MKAHKYNMGIVGNCSFIAYIDLSANVKWMCLPRFDSSFVFGSLLDETKGGEFSIRPYPNEYTSKKYYLKNTNILATEFEMADGRFRVIDYAPRFYQYERYFKPLMLFRKIELLEGNPLIVVKCNPVGDYGAIVPETDLASNHISYLNLGSSVRLTTDVALNYVISEKPFVLSETKYIVFSHGVPLEAPLAETAEIFLNKTKTYWLNWIKSTSIPSIFQDEVVRSALVLKLHQYEDTGAVIASGTMSLPEFNGSGRTWDYRYCWMRDTYYTLNAFNNIGHFEELEKYFLFIENIIINNKQGIKPMYTILGNKVSNEKFLPLEGYMGNKPVRTGNNAIDQTQNDVYGQILVSLLPLFVDKRINYHDERKSLFITKWLLDRIAENIDLPDSGLWEFGQTKQFHANTYLFHWAGSMAGLKISHILKNDSLRNKSILLRNKAIDYIERCYGNDKLAYTQAIDNFNLDASSLQFVTMNYLDPISEKARLHILAHEKELFDSQKLYLRYTHDDLGSTETSFIICGFWYAEALAANGQLDKPAQIIENLLKCSNHLGLFSEDADIHNGQWGNFPQTYSHVGLVNAVYRLSKKLDKPFFL
jgi:GH15 family glucan-1,4-alpha-glucosidase